jgi:hypothetical protein
MNFLTSFQICRPQRQIRCGATAFPEEPLVVSLRGAWEAVQ